MVQGSHRATTAPLLSRDKLAVKKRTAGHNDQHKVINKSKKLKSLNEYGKSQYKTTAAIKQQIESIMAARLVHEGGSLRVVEAPKREEVKSYIKSGIQLNTKHHRDLVNTNAARKQRIERQQKSLNSTTTTDNPTGKKSNNSQGKILSSTTSSISKKKYNELNAHQKSVFEHVELLKSEIAEEIDSDDELEQYIATGQLDETGLRNIGSKRKREEVEEGEESEEDSDSDDDEDESDDDGLETGLSAFKKKLKAG